MDTIEIQIGDFLGDPNAKMVKAEAHIIGKGLAVNQYDDDYHPADWRVTHLASGRAIIRGAREAETAINAALCLLQLDVDWTGPASAVLSQFLGDVNVDRCESLAAICRRFDMCRASDVAPRPSWAVPRG